MIPQIHITEWTRQAPWPLLWQVEQDLIITTALLKIYENPELKQTLAFRGGTALNKLFFKEPLRYSEDIDLVQINPGPIKSTIKLVQSILDPWLGKSEVKQNKINTTLIYKKIVSEDNIPLKLKIEIHTREHFSIKGYQHIDFISESSYHAGKSVITTYHLEELLGTKIRCLYQRTKGRDLYDLYMALIKSPELNSEDILTCFKEYMQRSGRQITKAEFLKSLQEKLDDTKFLTDIHPLLPPNSEEFNPREAYMYLYEKLFQKL